MTQYLDRWTLIFYGLMAVGVVAGIYHLASGRYGNGAIALSAVVVGLLIQREIAGMPQADEPRATAAEEPVHPGPEARWEGGTANRTNWLSNSIIAGFPATVVMTMVFIGGFLFSGAFANEDGNLISRWFWHLTNNSLTDSAYDIPIGAYSLNLLAGLVWAGVYGFFFEPRLRGAGWQRGMLFSIVPWLLSLVVFFPIVGAGFFGAALDAGPLPALGNLILHLVYGAVLGSIYSVPDTSAVDASGTSEWEAEWQNRGMTIGLVGGLVIGMIAGSALAVIISEGNAEATEMLLAGAAAGTMVGAIAGPLFGLSAGSRAHDRQEFIQESR
ncbi:MAG TPA: DUF6789 family protein [Thermomicrobiales bacterium]|nr:DUF6789 family protein [Thermomicrobiales bacterium]